MFSKRKTSRKEVVVKSVNGLVVNSVIWE